MALSESVQSLLRSLDSIISQSELEAIIDGDWAIESLDNNQLIAALEVANQAYRAGYPIISDSFYDHKLRAELQQRDSNHLFLHQVEPEPTFSAKTLRLPQRMLSTDKAYSMAEMELWVKRLQKAALESSVEQIMIRITPKLDGYAAYDDGARLYTRGDGYRGSDISRVFERGLKVGGDGVRGQGAGEIVIDQQYFDTYLSGNFDNSRNFQAAVLAEKNQDANVTQALLYGAVIFMPFKQLPNKERYIDNLFDEYEQLIEEIWTSSAFKVDGVIFEAVDERLKRHMGATQHHHRWQIAFKINSEKAQVRVLAVHPQTSRSGRVNPVVEVKPTELSGVTIRHVTAHHYAMVERQGIGVGTVIELVRSGMVIPKIEAIITPATPQIPDQCPSCRAELVWDSDYLLCTNSAHCTAQAQKRIEHFFYVLGNIDGFGDKTVIKLCDSGINSILAIYQLELEQLIAMGFGEKTSQNLLNELLRSRSQAIHDWRFLGAFGIPRLGLGNSEQLLTHCRLIDIFALTVEKIVQIEGFAQKTANELVNGLQAIKDDFFSLYQLGFNLMETELTTDKSDIDSPISQKLIVFTGKMQSPREIMETQAKALGAGVAKSVTSKTDYLVVGENVGAKKISNAEQKGVQIVEEAVYLEWLK